MRNLFLLFIELVLSYGTNQRIDPNCPWVHQPPWSVFLAHFDVYNIQYIFIYVSSDYDLNAICHETCIEETYKCIMSCEPTDSTCIYTCLRAEDSCRASKNFHIKVMKHFGFNDPAFIRSNLKFHWGCPCDIECPNGCDDCENSICECSVSSRHFFSDIGINIFFSGCHPKCWLEQMPWCQWNVFGKMHLQLWR